MNRKTVYKKKICPDLLLVIKESTDSREIILELKSTGRKVVTKELFLGSLVSYLEAEAPNLALSEAFDCH